MTSTNPTETTSNTSTSNDKWKCTTCSLINVQTSYLCQACYTRCPQPNKVISVYRNRLKKYNQEHLLDYVSQLNDNQTHNLLSQILKIDLENMEFLLKKVGLNNNKRILYIL